MLVEPGQRTGVLAPGDRSLLGAIQTSPWWEVGEAKALVLLALGFEGPTAL